MGAVAVHASSPSDGDRTGSMSSRPRATVRLAGVARMYATRKTAGAWSTKPSVCRGLDACVMQVGCRRWDGSSTRVAGRVDTVLETNVVVPHRAPRRRRDLERSGGRALFPSSASVDDPRPFLVPYGASKAASTRRARWRNQIHRPLLRPSRRRSDGDRVRHGWASATLGDLAEARAERDRPGNRHDGRRGRRAGARRPHRARLVGRPPADAEEPARLTPVASATSTPARAEASPGSGPSR